MVVLAGLREHLQANASMGAHRLSPPPPAAVDEEDGRAEGAQAERLEPGGRVKAREGAALVVDAHGHERRAVAQRELQG